MQTKRDTGRAPMCRAARVWGWQVRSRPSLESRNKRSISQQKYLARGQRDGIPALSFSLLRLVCVRSLHTLRAVPLPRMQGRGMWRLQCSLAHKLAWSGYHCLQAGTKKNPVEVFFFAM